MPVPKKKTSKSKTRSRRASNYKIGMPAISRCPKCYGTKAPHVVCPNCGWYKGRQAIEIS